MHRVGRLAYSAGDYRRVAAIHTIFPYIVCVGLVDGERSTTSKTYGNVVHRGVRKRVHHYVQVRDTVTSAAVGVWSDYRVYRSGEYPVFVHCRPVVAAASADSRVHLRSCRDGDGAHLLFVATVIGVVGVDGEGVYLAACSTRYFTVDRVFRGVHVCDGQTIRQRRRNIYGCVFVGDDDRSYATTLANRLCGVGDI